LFGRFIGAAGAPARLIFGIHAKNHTDEATERPNKERSLWSDFRLKNLWIKIRAILDPFIE